MEKSYNSDAAPATWLEFFHHHASGIGWLIFWVVFFGFQTLTTVLSK